MTFAINKNETEITGSWITKGKDVVSDESCLRIQKLVAEYLKPVAKGEWCTLYIDGADQRYWELFYPQSEMQGGGPPALKNLSADEANRKYNLKLWKETK